MVRKLLAVIVSVVLAVSLGTTAFAFGSGGGGSGGVTTAATTTPGVWVLQAGKTVTLSQMNINSCNVDFAFLLVFDHNGTLIYTPNLGTNNGSTCANTTIAPFSYTNTSGQTETLKFRLDDTTCGAAQYDSDGQGPANHATTSGKAASINDAGPACQNQITTSQPAKGRHGNFNVALSFK